MSIQDSFLKRIFFRLKMIDINENDDVVNIVNFFFQRELALNKNYFISHYIHIQSQKNQRYYYFVLIMNYVEASFEIKIQDVHHEFYKIRLHKRNIS